MRLQLSFLLGLQANNSRSSDVNDKAEYTGVTAATLLGAFAYCGLFYSLCFFADSHP